jgi:tryptophan synthase alpha chain
MSNRIKTLFEEKKNNILSIYFTAGYPQLNDTAEIIQTLEKSGVDLIEIGMPFSDPVADGPIIQRSSEIALDNGMSINLLFDQLKDIRKSVKIPLILMGYINPVLQYGLVRFCQTCNETGIDGLILPDLPLQTYLDEYKEVFEKYGIYNIFLVTPQSSDERIRWIDSNSKGFVYLVASFSVTGTKTGIDDQQMAYFKRIKSLGLTNPTLVGFGINNKDSFQKASQFSNGAIIGSAFIKALDGEGKLEEKISTFSKSIAN